MAKESSAQPSSVAQGQPAKEPQTGEELPAYVPAPKSLISNTEATQVAAVNPSANNDAKAVLTSMPKPIESVIASSTRNRIAQVNFPADQKMKAGETRKIAVELKSDVPLALAIVALRFDPKVVKVRSISAGTVLDGKSSVTPSIDAAGTSLISISNPSGFVAPQSGALLFIEVEAIADGDAGLAFNKDAMHLVATDARDVSLEVVSVSAAPKQ